jgi:hypothetical protein
LRIPARWVLDDLDSAVAAIRTDLQEHSPHRPMGPPPPHGEALGIRCPPPGGAVSAEPTVGGVS